MQKDKTLIVLNYQREIPPFMQMEIGVARNYFDRIIYITRPLVKNNRDSILSTNVSVIEVSRKLRKQLMIIAPIKACFNYWTLKQMLNKVSIGSIKSILSHFYCALSLYITSRNIISYLLKQNQEVYILAAWMNTEATAACWLKKELPEIKAYSLAHSFEVIPERNKYLLQNFHELHHLKLDKVYFISKKVRDLYLDGMKSLNIRERFSAKIGIRYLGCLKPNNALNPNSTSSEAFHIVTCSRIDENKRLSMIVAALSLIKNQRIKWTIIGDGVLKEQIANETNNLTKNNSLITVDLVGQYSNKQVNEFYKNNHIDLFINVSRIEGLPVSIMEAFSYGIPAIGTDVGGTSEIITDANGFLIDRDFTPQDLAQLITQYMHLSSDKINAYREKAYQTWQHNFDASVNSINMYKEWEK